ncbi:MAG TPA: VCBS repeat-containing protein [Opitutaceae bacterium]|nr:VCBS repeat-containing protein [Opitutaceae bacterium]
MRSRPAIILVAVLGTAAAIIVGILLSGTGGKRPADSELQTSAPASTPARIEYLPTPIGARVGEFGRPLVTNVAIADLDRDGLPDVLYCEALQNTVRWIRQSPRGVFTEIVIGESIPSPAHVAVADINGSGRLDVLVASMGQLMPSNDTIGSVVVLEHLGDGSFQKRVLLENVARVTDVRAANLAGHTDRKLDLVVGQFGYAQGETRWMKNLGNWKFESTKVSTLSGCIHTPVADFDGDGTDDFAALISQEWEEIHLFRNTRRGLQHNIVWGSTNEDYGSSGLDVADVNGDGRPDLIYTNGDGFDYAVQGPRPWHGIQWLENRGSGVFTFHRVGDLPGAYAPCAADFNGDGFIDLLAVSCFADWSDPGAVSMMLWLNDGRERFTPVVLAHRPTHLVTAAVGDLDGDGVPEIVTGGFHAFPPYDNMSNITLWRRK